MKSAERQFAAFMARYSPEIRRLADEALEKMVHDNHDAADLDAPAVARST